MALPLPRRTGKGLQASRIFCPTDCGDSTIQNKYDARPTLPSTLANDSRDTYGIKPREHRYLPEPSGRQVAHANRATGREIAAIVQLRNQAAAAAPPTGRRIGWRARRSVPQLPAPLWPTRHRGLREVQTSGWMTLPKEKGTPHPHLVRPDRLPAPSRFVSHANKAY